jgi:hypothetical protein
MATSTQPFFLLRRKRKTGENGHLRSTRHGRYWMQHAAWKESLPAEIEPSEKAGQRLSSTADIKELSGLVFSWSFSCFRLSVSPCFENMGRNTMADSLDQSFYRSIQSSQHENFQSWSSLSSIREAINHIFHLERRPLLRLSDHHTLIFLHIYIPSVR